MQNKLQRKLGAFRGSEKRGYFEGWYLKQQKGKNMISFIPAFHVDQYGEENVSLQIITPEQSWNIPFDMNDFYACKQSFYCRIGENIFCQKGMSLNVENDVISLKGRLTFGAFSPLTYDIMGPFARIPWMECSHGILSMGHTVRGSLLLNGKELSFEEGIGYAEKDSGVSFPEKYLWTQCNFSDQGHVNLSLAIAKIPIGKLSFTGCICEIHYEKDRYRFATYLGARVIRCTEGEIIISQGNCFLRVHFRQEAGLPLKAPDRGNMSREVNEVLKGTARYRFWKDGISIFDLTSNRASWEMVKERLRW